MATQPILRDARLRALLSMRPMRWRCAKEPTPAIVRIMSEARQTGAFFGRRKGHPLRQRQAALMDTLLPRLKLDLAAPAPADLRALFHAVDEVRLASGVGG